MTGLRSFNDSTSKTERVLDLLETGTGYLRLREFVRSFVLSLRAGV